MVAIANKISAVKSYSCGLMSELIGFEDAEGRAWTLTRDELSRITKIQGPLNILKSFTL